MGWDHPEIRNRRHNTWEEQIGTSGAEYIWGIDVASEGSLHVTGRTESALDGANSGSNDVFVRIYAAAPPSPTLATAQPSASEVSISWTAPELEPDDVIVSYTVNGTPSGTCTTTNTTCTISGLTNGVSYSLLSPQTMTLDFQASQHHP